MAKGGVYDHLGGGFHRYSVDSQWLVPHFEKMLYDQALLSRIYIQTCQATDKEIYAKTARDTFDYVLRDMTDVGGGFSRSQCFTRLFCHIKAHIHPVLVTDQRPYETVLLIFWKLNRLNKQVISIGNLTGKIKDYAYFAAWLRYVR
jgi:hypothetical protein